MNRAVKINGLLALALVTGLLLVASFLISKPINVLFLGILLALGIESMGTFWALLWALPRSNSAFFSIFVADALVRLAGLGVVSYWLWSRHLPYTAPLLSLGFAYLVYSLVQVPFFYKAR